VTVARWMLFCEAAEDHRTIEALVDALLRLWGDEWVSDVLDTQPESVRCWWCHEGDRCWYDLHKVYALADDLEVQRHYGHFAGEPANAWAVTLDTVFRIVRKVHSKHPPAERPTAVIVVWDADKEPGYRLDGIEKAMKHAVDVPAGVVRVVALAVPEREAWVLAGFDPVDDGERVRLAAWRQQLGYAPHENAHRLSAGSGAAKDDSKAVLGDLCPTAERQRACLAIPDHERRGVLLARGLFSGLKGWIESVEELLLPQVDPGVKGRLRQS
jgi:hypothetical protein